MKARKLIAVAVVVLAVLPLTTSTSVAEPREPRQFDPATVTLDLVDPIDGFELPSQVTSAGDGSERLFVSELAGRVWITVDGQELDEPFLDISELVRDAEGEQGFFGIEFHPDYAENGYFFAFYTREPDGANVVARFRVSAADPNRADPDSLVELIALPDRLPNHNGGDLAFDANGYLYIGTGDEGGYGVPADPYQNPQDGRSLYGKMLRVDPSLSPDAVSGAAYSIPPDNPFVDDPGVRDEIWALGLRNPFRFSIDRETGGLYIGDVGEAMWEEINYEPGSSPGGRNYGWPVMEGARCFPDDDTDCDVEGLTPPVLEYRHEQEPGEPDACSSVTGGHVYRGEAAPFMAGIYIFGDWCDGRIWAAYQDGSGSWRMHQLLNTFINITSFGQDEAGELYLTDMLGGRVYRLQFTLGDAGPPEITAILPGGALAGAEDLLLAVRGQRFVEGSVVLWDDESLPTIFESSTTLYATVPAARLAQAGEAAISVRNPEDGEISGPTLFIVSSDVFGNPEFARIWERTDRLVGQQSAGRTWIWGPGPITPSRSEPYSDSPGGERRVLYFDKSRMEINNPAGDSQSPWYVTNGLLVLELMTGRLQTGDASYEQREPAAINVAGDPSDPDGVTYAVLAGLRGAAAHDEGQAITAVLSGRGDIAGDPALAVRGVTAGPLRAETGHRVASVFWDFMTSQGPIYENGMVQEGPLFENPYFATGLPITEAYWTTVEVGGTEKLVLLQCFERRCLTYTPDNPPAWRVEAGNVGRHYYRWRYDT